MDEVIEFTEVFNRRYDDFGEVDSYIGRYGESDTEKIEASLQVITGIFKSCKIPVEEDTSRTDPRCVKAFKFLLLNTDLKCKHDLARDPEIGPFVTIGRRRMTPYFLVEVVLCLEYEQILAESLSHMPLDMSNEIIEIVKNDIFLWDFERGLNLVIAIILNCHKNLITTCKTGAQSRDVEKNLETLMISTQEYIALLSNIKFLRLSEVKSLQKSERIGTILAKLIALTIKCLSGTDNDSLSPEIAEYYRLTFGNDPIRRCGHNFNTTLSMLNQEFIHILLKKLEEIDDECYDNWAAIDANGNNLVTMQCSIRRDLYNFIEFLKGYRKFVVHSRRLKEVIQKLKPQPVNRVSALNLDGLRNGSIEMKIETIKSVIHRYSEWDHDTFDLIQRNRSLLDVDDIPYLIDYLTYIIKKPCQENHKRRVFVTIRKVLFQQRILDDWAIKHIDPFNVQPRDFQEGEANDAQEEEPNNAQNREEAQNPDILECLDPAYSDDNFKSFIAGNEDLKSPHNLQTTLLYLLNNPRNVLQILIEVIIGVPDYAHLSIPPEILIFFHPMVKLGGSTMRLLLLEMRNVIIRRDKWDAKKFADLVNLMLEKSKFTANDFVSYVFAYWLEKQPTDISDFVHVLKFVNDCVTPKCIAGLDIYRLAEAFAARLKDIRRDIPLPRSVSDPIIDGIRRTAEPFFYLYGVKIQDDFLMLRLEAIDRFKLPFVLLSSSIIVYSESFGSSIVSDLRYECLIGIQRARTRVRGFIPISPDAPTHYRDFEPLKEDFVRYTLIKCSETEIVQLAENIAEFELMDYNARCRLEIVNSILHNFIETAIYFLEFPHLNPPESFACIMRSLALSVGKVLLEMMKEFNIWDGAFEYRENVDCLRKMYRAYRLLKNGLKALTVTVRHSTFYPLYQSLMTTVDDPSLHNEPHGVALCRIRSALEKFGTDCYGIAHSDVRFNKAPSPEALRIKKSHDFVDECLNVGLSETDDPSQYYSLCATFKELRTQV